jgi:hypothetical protein
MQSRARLAVDIGGTPTRHQYTVDCLPWRRQAEVIDLLVNIVERYHKPTKYSFEYKGSRLNNDN